MKRKDFVILVILLVAVIVGTLLLPTSGREITNVRIFLNSTPLNIPEEYGQPFIDVNSRTMIPLRIVAERLGHDVKWDNATRTAIIDDAVFVTIGEKTIKTPDGTVEMDTYAILKPTGTATGGSRTYVPLRFVVEALGYEVEYEGPKASNDYHHVVNIFSPNYVPGDDSGTGSGERIGVLYNGDFSKDPVITDYFSKYKPEQYMIVKGGVSFDPQYVGNALQAIDLANFIEYDGYYRLIINRFGEQEQEVLEFLLKYVAGNEAGQKIFDFLKEGYTNGKVLKIRL